MKKILLSMVLVGSLFGDIGDITDVSIISSDYHNININGTFQEDTQIFEMYIDTDGDETSGFTNVLGAEYLVANGDVFKYIGDGTSDEFDDNWDWLYTLYVDELDIESDNIYLGLDFGWHGFDNINIANYGIKTYSDNWDLQASYSNDNQGGNGGSDNNQYNKSVIYEAISIFEQHQELNNVNDYNEDLEYSYAVYLSSQDDEYNEYGGYEFQKRGATLGRIFTTGNTFENFHDYSDAGKVIKKYKEILENNGENTNKDIITLFELDLVDDENFLNTQDILDAINNEDNLNFDNDIKPLGNDTILDNIMIAWQDASSDNYFRQAQDEIYEETTFDPAKEKLEEQGIDMSKITTLSYLAVINTYVLKGEDGDDLVSNFFSENVNSDNFNNNIAYQIEKIIDFVNYYSDKDGEYISEHRTRAILALLENARDNDLDIANNLSIDDIFEAYQNTEN